MGALRHDDVGDDEHDKECLEDHQAEDEPLHNPGLRFVVVLLPELLVPEMVMVRAALESHDADGDTHTQRCAQVGALDLLPDGGGAVDAEQPGARIIVEGDALHDAVQWSARAPVAYRAADRRGRFRLERGRRAIPVAQWVQCVTSTLPRSQVGGNVARPVSHRESRLRMRHYRTRLRAGPAQPLYLYALVGT
jgi:hypothetical protein